VRRTSHMRAWRYMLCIAAIADYASIAYVRFSCTAPLPLTEILDEGI
jgi:hypothetical protein